jgi:intracellular multiplication protein IcmL
MSEKIVKKERKPDTLRRVNMRNNFFWVQYRVLLTALFLTGVLLLAGLGGLYHFATFEPPHKYIPTTPDFKVLVSPPLNEEYIKEGDAIEVATSGLRGVYTYDFVNWQDQLTSAQKWFTVEGWNAFGNEFKESGAITSVIRRGQVVSIRLIEGPIVKQKGLNNNQRFTWLVEFPKAEVTYRAFNGKDTVSFVYKINIEVVRENLGVYSKGAAINAVRVGLIKG